jgi:ribosomal protein L37AE/L43A
MRADPKPAKKIKTHKCRFCKKDYVKTNPMFTWCSNDCAFELSKIIMDKQKRQALIKQRQNTKIEKEKLKTKGNYIKELQTVFNRLIRLIDKDQPCIARNYKSDERSNMWDAGHLYSTGSVPALRFWAHNVHKQSKASNRDKGGDPMLYQENLVIRYGQKYLQNLVIARKLFIKMNWSKEQLYKSKIECLLIEREIKSGKAITRDEINARLELYDLSVYNIAIKENG